MSHRFNLSLILLLLASAFLLLPERAAATSLPPLCPVASLFDYENNLPGGQCSQGSLIYLNFKFPTPTGSSPTLDSANQILVTPGSYGFMFSQVSGTPFSVAKGQTAFYTIDYQFAIDPAPVLEGADLSLDPPFGNVTITQYYCNDGLLLNTSLCVGATSTPQSLTVHNPDQLTASKIFNPPAFSFGSVRTVISLDGTLAAAGFDGVEGKAKVTGDPLVTPEPAAIVLALSGLFAVCASKRRKT